MIFTKENIDARVAVTLSAYQDWHDKQSDKGFRTNSLSLAGPPSAPLYTAVMVKRDPPFAGHSWAKLSRAQLDAKIAEVAKQNPPLRPYIIAATGPQAEAVYAASFRRTAEEPVIKPDLSADQLAAENEQQRKAGKILTSVDAFGTADDIRYCAIWAGNGANLAWNAESLNETGKRLQQRTSAMAALAARPTLVAVTPSGGLAALYVDDWLQQDWVMEPAMSAAEFETRRAKEAAAGRFPVRIGSATVDGAVRFAAIFAAGDDIVARGKPRVQGPDPILLSTADEANAAKIDEWMKSYLTTNVMRGAALAIVKDTRLVYAKGFTYAEPAPLYDDVLPTTLFRLGSVSKLFCAVAAWKALAADPKHSRNSLMHTLLGLPAGTPMADGFKNITIRHLLESNSGIRQTSKGDIINDNAKDKNGKQPMTGLAIATAVAAEPMSGVPGAMLANGKQATSYGKTDYILLGRVVAKLAGEPDFDSALKKLVLDPLHMTRTRGSRARLKDKAADEARQHTRDLATAISEMHSEFPRPLVPVQYEGSNCDVYDGAGGVSAAVVDVARLGAMLACRSANPIFPTTATLDAMLSDAVAATAAGSDQGYHGFDWATGSSPTIRYSKGGTLGDSAGSGIEGKTGELVIVIFRNGAYLPDGVSDWKQAIPDLANAVNWGPGDLFPTPQFGMPSL
jgi:CubicO group peptidase (beta-lactamase class C family)